MKNKKKMKKLACKNYHMTKFSIHYDKVESQLTSLASINF